MLHFDDIVFGPVNSRRLGSSLGVNLLPSKGKLCNFDCVYCECGWNKDGADDKVFPSFEKVTAELKKRFAELSSDGVAVDSITFSGNGEPTLHPDFAGVIDVTLDLRDRYFPDAKVSVLSNATMIVRDDVARALMRVDNPVLKIDGASDDLVEMVNRPVGSYSLSAVVDAMKRFDGNFVLQTMFLKSDRFDMASSGNLKAWMDIVREVRPREIMVYTIDRETPDKSLAKYTVDQMRDFVRPLLDEGYNIQIRG